MEPADLSKSSSRRVRVTHAYYHISFCLSAKLAVMMLPAATSVRPTTTIVHSMIVKAKVTF